MIAILLLLVALVIEPLLHSGVGDRAALFIVFIAVGSLVVFVDGVEGTRAVERLILGFLAFLQDSGADFVRDFRLVFELDFVFRVTAEGHSRVRTFVVLGPRSRADLFGGRLLFVLGAKEEWTPVDWRGRGFDYHNVQDKAKEEGD